MPPKDKPSKDKPKDWTSMFKKRVEDATKARTGSDTYSGKKAKEKQGKKDKNPDDPKNW